MLPIGYGVWNSHRQLHQLWWGIQPEICTRLINLHMTLCSSNLRSAQALHVLNTLNPAHTGTNFLGPNLGWRLSLGLASVPALVFFVGSLLLPDTPNSLVQRGFEKEGRQVCD